MKKTVLSILALGLATAACERPSDPNFKLEQKIHAPILFNKTFQFLGGSEALIDTTSADFDSLFATDGNGVISFSMSEDFDIGDLDDAIPKVDVDPVSINSAVGELGLDDFSSQSSLGEAGFEDFTGINPALIGPGDPIPPGNATVEIDLDTDQFVSATLRGGSVEITVTNELGFEVDTTTISLKSGSSTVLGQDTITNFADGTDRSATINFSEDDVLQDLRAEVEVTWTAKTMDDNPDKLEVKDLQGQNLFAKQVEAALDAQEFTSTGTVPVDDTDFQFTDAGHYIEIESGQLVVDQIINQIDLGLDTLIISFPDIRSAPYGPADSLVVRFEGATQIQRSTGGLPQPTQNVALAGLRIVGPDNNNLDYNIRGVTEQTGGTADEVRTINETDSFSAVVSIQNLTVNSAFGNIQEKEILVSNDDNSNGTDVLDLFNEDEAEVISIDALGGLSDNGGFEFTNPTLSIRYQSNLDVPVEIIGAILGVDDEGNEIFLTGAAASPYEVTAGESPADATFRSNGSPLGVSDMIKLPLPATGGGSASNTISFDAANSNVDEFLNNLPSQIRFIGIARINEGAGEGTVISPVEFDPELSLEVPLEFSAQDAGYSDTTDVDLGDFPNPAEDEQQLTEASINIRYDNLLPFKVEVNMVMLDSSNVELTHIPLAGGEPPTVGGAPVGTDGFVTEGNVGNLVFNLNSSQLEVLHRTRAMRVSVTFNTTGNTSVKVRASDSITINISMRATVETTVD